MEDNVEFNEWFNREFGPKPDGNYYPHDLSQWCSRKWGAWMAWLHLGLKFHENDLPFGEAARKKRESRKKKAK